MVVVCFEQCILRTNRASIAVVFDIDLGRSFVVISIVSYNVYCSIHRQIVMRQIACERWHSVNKTTSLRMPMSEDLNNGTKRRMQGQETLSDMCVTTGE